MVIKLLLDYPEDDPSITLILSCKGTSRVKKFDIKSNFRSDVF